MRVALQTADAMSLPLADGCSDTVACQFVVMFFPNKEKSYSEVNRVLAPRGRYVLNVVGCAPHHNPSAQIAMRVMDGFQ